MRYTVAWLPSAQTTLARLWMQAPTPQAVTEASNRIDALLLNDPETRGTAFGKFFVHDSQPLSVLYEVDPGDCMVRVIAVKRI